MDFLFTCRDSPSDALNLLKGSPPKTKARVTTHVPNPLPGFPLGGGNDENTLTPALSQREREKRWSDAWQLSFLRKQESRWGEMSEL